MDLVFLGPPGAGKGTQAKLASRQLAIPHLSTGDLLRTAVAAGTELGVEARSFMERGLLVPDELVGRMVEARLAECGNGFLLDGYPRNLLQAQVLDQIEGRLVRSLTHVVLIDVSDEVIADRLSGRRSCSNSHCGAVYHVSFNPPRRGEMCDVCNGALTIRKDDQADVVRARLAVYHQETEPLLAAYSKRKLLRRVDGTGALDDVLAAVLAVVKAG